VTKHIAAFFMLLGVLSFTSAAPAAETPSDYQLGSGDAIRITVFQNPDMTLETRVSESGAINYPLIGTVQVGGLSTAAAEKLIAEKLKDGNFVKRPQVNIALTEVRGSQVVVLGMVGKPGRFPLESSSMRLSDVLAQSGGVLPSAGAGTAVLSGRRDGKPMRREIEIAALFGEDGAKSDVLLKGGDVVYVAPGNLVSVLGQVSKPGRYPLENAHMHLTEVVSLAGGLAPDASDTVVVTGQRDGKPYSKEVDIASLYLDHHPEDNVTIAAGDEIYVHRAPMYYIYGEAQKPGAYRIERSMTVMQALALGGGPTTRGTERNIKLLRRKAHGTEELNPKMSDLVLPDDVIFVRESLF
jgi:polysaccharide export outer membrane protein